MANLFKIQRVMSLFRRPVVILELEFDIFVLRGEKSLVCLTTLCQCKTMTSVYPLETGGSSIISSQ